MRIKIYANHLGMIPSTEIAHALRLDAERKRDAAEDQKRREARALERGSRHRDFWSRLRESLSATLRAA